MDYVLVLILTAHQLVAGLGWSSSVGSTFGPYHYIRPQDYTEETVIKVMSEFPNGDGTCKITDENERKRVTRLAKVYNEVYPAIPAGVNRNLLTGKYWESKAMCLTTDDFEELQKR